MQSVKTTSPLNREIAPLFRRRHPSEPKLPLATGFDQNNVFAKSRCEIHSHRLFCFLHFADDPAEFLLFSRKIAPGARMSPGGAAVYAGICARLISGSSQPMLSVGASAELRSRCVRPELQPNFAADAFGRSFSRASRPMRSVGASAELHGRGFRSELQPGFTADAFGRFFSRFSKRPWNRRT